MDHMSGSPGSRLRAEDLHLGIYSQDQQLWGREGSCTGQRVNLNHSAIATKDLSHPVGSFATRMVLLNYLEFRQIGWTFIHPV